MTCANCGAANAPGDKFCQRCGAALGTPAAAAPTWGSAADTATPPSRSEYIYGAPPSATDAIPPSPYAAPPTAPYAAPTTPYAAPPAPSYSAPATPPYGPPPPYAAPTEAYTVPTDPAWRPPDTLTPVARRNPAPLGLIAVLGALLLIGLAAVAVFMVGSNRHKRLLCRRNPLLGRPRQCGLALSNPLLGRPRRLVLPPWSAARCPATRWGGPSSRPSKRITMPRSRLSTTLIRKC